MKTTFLAAFAALFALPALAQDIAIDDAYARSAGARAIAGAAFFMIENHGTEDDRLIAARSPVAERVELHTHIADGEGVMRMVEVEDGF
ncbi:MAG: copper chaperone PCu(A)C, partial [Hyphomicrobiales bacterium]|nr:copper chaperone PCu(A)C [Hyphomicrobiales bacterium]